MPGPSSRFFWLLGLLTMGACAAYAAAILASASLADVRALDGIAAEHEHWHIQLVTASGLRNLTLTLGLTAAVLSIAGAFLAGTAGRTELTALGAELRASWLAPLRSWRRLPRRARLGAWLGLGFLTILRSYFSLTKPLHAEEIASYEFFVSKGLLAISAYYPIPNNHILSSTISWIFYSLNPGFWWSMRLPVLLISTVGTMGLFLGLLRWSNFRVALWATAGFCGLQLSLYNASAGRGYWLLIALAGLLFFSTLTLTWAREHQRAAWLGLLVAGVAGCYTVPTFAYALASALAWLGLQSLRQRNWAQLARLVVMALTIAAACLALYVPLMLVSGAGILFGNGFVAAQPAGVFWPGFPAFLWFTEGMLAGQRTVGGLLVLAVVAATGCWILRMRHRSATLLNTRTGRVRLAEISLWFALVPYVLVVAQRVFPPERVLLYKSFFLFILVGMLADAWLRQRFPMWVRRWSGWALVAGFAVFAVYQTYYVEFLNRHNRATVAAYRAGFEWLAQQPTGPVLAPEPLHNLYFRYYAHTAAPARLWQLDKVRRPNRRYTYVVAFPKQRGAFQPHFPFPPAYANSEVEIFVIPQ
jgi:hypothetical protein